MREILSHGKRLDNGEWVEGFYVCLNSKSHRIYNGCAETDCGDYYPAWFEVIPETVGQYTGMRDCKRTAEYPKGQMIFEGDVIKVERDLHCGENKKEREIFNGVVWYDDKHTCFGIKSKKYRCLPIHRFKGDYSTIIGNIHDNPEQMTEGGEE